MKILLLIAGFVGVLTLGTYWFMQPGSYDDCILKHISSTTTKYAAQVVRKACERKFGEAGPIAENELAPVSRPELSGARNIRFDPSTADQFEPNNKEEDSK